MNELKEMNKSIKMNRMNEMKGFVLIILNKP